MNTITFRKSSLFRYISLTVMVSFIGLLPVSPSYAQVAIIMPPPGQMIHFTQHFEPPQMVGLKIDIKNPFNFDFIMDRGENPMSDDVKKEEFNKIIKYFLVSLAMPNKDMWVNLSPYESTHIIPQVFAQTEMGRDLLAQDYILKQFTASIMYPEDGLGKKFWDTVYQQAQARFGTTEINVNTFNKVWIVADHADVYQKDNTAFLVGSHLKVMLEQDYMAIENNKEMFGNVSAINKDETVDPKTQMASQLVREIIIPAIEKEVNEGQSFAAVRQVYNAEIMATWFKKTLKQSLLGQVFANTSKIAGQRVSDPQAAEKIYNQYLLAYKEGVYNYIRKDVTPDGQIIPRKYFSGGMKEVGVQDVHSFSDRDLAQTSELPTPSQFESRISDMPGLDQGARDQMRAKIEQQFEQKGIDRASPMTPELADHVASIISHQLPSDSALVATLTKPLFEQPVRQEVQEFQTNGENLVQSQRWDDANVRFTPAVRPQLEMPAVQESTLSTAAVRSFLTQQGVINDKLASSEEALRTVFNATVAGTTNRPEVQSAADYLTHEAGMKPEILTRMMTERQVPAAVFNQPAENVLPAETVDRFLSHQGVVPGQLREAATAAIRDLVSEQGAPTERTHSAVALLTKAGMPEPMVRQLSEGAVPAAMFNQSTGNSLPTEAVNRFLNDQIADVKQMREAANAFRDLVNEAGASGERATRAVTTLTNAGMPEPMVRELSEGRIPAAMFNRPQRVTLPTEAVDRFLGDQGVAGDQIKQASEAVRNLVSEAGVPTERTPSVVALLTNAGLPQTIVKQLSEGKVPAAMFREPAAAPVVEPTVLIARALGSIARRETDTVKSTQTISGILEQMAPTANPADLRGLASNITQSFQQASRPQDLTSTVGNVAQQLATEPSINSQVQGASPSMESIQQGLTNQFGQQIAQNQYLPLYNNNIQQIDNLQVPGSTNTLNDLLENMVQEGQIQREKIQEALDNIRQIESARKEAVGHVASQIKTAAPMMTEIATSVADEMVKAEINHQAASKTLGGISLNNEQLTMNIKVDGAGMPLPSQYQDKAMLNLSGLISTIHSITPLTKENVPALYELLK